MNWYIKVLKNFSNFSGRARRSEYWFFVLFNFIFAMLAMILDNILGTTIDIPYATINYGYLYFLYALFAFMPGLAVAIRRLHDIGKSGWMFLVVLIPCVGPIWLLILLCTDSQQGENKWGDYTK